MAIKKRYKDMNEFQKIEGEIEEEVNEIEKWIIERRKFFIKFSFVIVFLVLLLIYARFFMK